MMLAIPRLRDEGEGQPLMKLQRLIAIISVLLNAALLIEVYFSRSHETDPLVSEAQVSGWAGYAGAKQAEADFGRGVRRVYRAAPAASCDDRGGFTGERDGAAEIWACVYHPGLGEADRIGADAFAGAYNETMRGYLAGPMDAAGHASLKSRGPATPAAGTRDR